MAETTICKQCVHYLVCMHYSATRKECKQFQAETNHVEVVRCKDCKHCHVASWGERFCARDKTVELGELKEDDFCSYGERKDNA